MSNSSIELGQWTKKQIDSECGRAFRSYERELVEHYTRYFQNNADLRCPRHPYSARTVAAALPPECADLLERMPKGSLHRFCRSGRSSQIIGLALLGTAAKIDNSLCWLWPALRLPARLAGRQSPLVRFEHCLAPSDLGEVPRTSKIDVTVATEETFIALETKWSEPGLGTCSCAREGEGDPRIGFECAQRVYSRRAYWQVAQELFGLEETRVSFVPCALSPAYQAIRNVAAARQLSRGRRAGFVLIYDNANPFFRPTGRWPGWPQILSTTLGKHSAGGFFFQSISWQSLIKSLPLDVGVRLWAQEKHRL